jgi:uncharacterized membrane protein
MFIASLVITIIMSLTMIGFGYLVAKKTPKDIGSEIGYRTPMSTKNKDTWNFAHNYAGKVWVRSGIITVTVSVVLIFALQGLDNYEQLMLGMFYLQIVILLMVIPLTEIALRKTFDKRGVRKSSKQVS